MLYATCGKCMKHLRFLHGDYHEDGCVIICAKWQIMILFMWNSISNKLDCEYVVCG